MVNRRQLLQAFGLIPIAALLPVLAANPTLTDVAKGIWAARKPYVAPAVSEGVVAWSPQGLQFMMYIGDRRIECGDMKLLWTEG